MTTKALTFQYKAQYHKLGEIDEGTREIWFVLHGYGQLAKYFVKKFNVLHEQGIVVIAPEALSNFYLENLPSRIKDNDTRVCASWMTKENRLMDIENYTSYLNELYALELHNNTDIRVTVLGFSQGAATASRWIGAGKIRCDKLILWAGLLPPDMDAEAEKVNFINKEIFFIYGKRDPFLNDTRFTEMQQLCHKLTISPKVIEFDGDHDIDERTLLTLL